MAHAVAGLHGLMIDIEAALTDGKPPTPEVLAQLSALKADLAQNIASLPPYDQRSCTQVCRTFKPC